MSPTPAAFSAEFRLHAACTLRPDRVREQWREQVLALAHQVTDWAALQALVRRHQTYRLVYEALQEFVPHVVSVPAEVLECLASFATRSHSDGLICLSEARRIADLFQHAAIPVLQLKGAPLSARLYGDALLRHSKGVDLLVPSAALSEAVHLLLRSGYSPDAPLPHGPWQRHADQHCVLRSPNNVLVELHCRLGAYSEVRTNRMIAQSLPDATTGLSVLSPIAELAYLVVHGTRHYWLRLKWLSDIKQALLCMPEASWEGFAEECADCGAHSAAEVTSRVLEAVFDTPSPQLPLGAGHQPRHGRSINYVLYRMQAPVELTHGIRAAVDRTFYRLDCSPSQDKLAAAMHAVRRFTVRHA